MTIDAKSWLSPLENLWSLVALKTSTLQAHVSGVWRGKFIRTVCVFQLRMKEFSFVVRLSIFGHLLPLSNESWSFLRHPVDCKSRNCFRFVTNPFCKLPVFKVYSKITSRMMVKYDLLSLTCPRFDCVYFFEAILLFRTRILISNWNYVSMVKRCL